MRIDNEPTLTMVFPVGIESGPAVQGLILSLTRIARHHELTFKIKTGECISPISISGDIDIERAEAIKCEALEYVELWGFTKI